MLSHSDVRDKREVRALWIPINLDLAIYPTHLRWPAAFVFDLVHRKHIYREVNAQGYAQLKAAYVRKFVGEKLWKELLPVLLGAALNPATGELYPAVLECDGSVIRGVKCLGYRFASAYWHAERVICPDRAFAERITRTYDRLAPKLTRTQRGLRTWVGRLTIDVTAALATIATLRTPRRKRGDKRPAAERRAEYVNRLAAQVHRFADECERFEPDDYGRCHHVLTNLPKRLLCHVRIDGQRLHEIDVSACQPILLGMTAIAYHTGNRMTRSRLCNLRYSQQRGYGPTLRLLHTQIHIQCAEVRNPNGDKDMRKSLSVTAPPDVLEWVELAQRPDFYLRLMTRAQRARVAREAKRGRKTFLARFKVGVLASLYGKDEPGKYPRKLRDRLMKRFPNVFGFLSALKRRGYEQAAQTMQHVESSVMIERVCGRILEQMTGAPAVPRHDSVCTTEQFTDMVRTIMREEFARLGLTPNLKTKEHDR